jgi:hypothetical protein
VIVRCRYCRTPLRAAESIAAGYGPECAAIHNLPTPERLAYLRTLDDRDQLRAIFTRPLRKR